MGNLERADEWIALDEEVELFTTVHKFEYRTMAWTTRHELEYIDNIHNRNSYMDKQKLELLLRGYLIGCKKRENWMKMDKNKVLRKINIKLKSIAASSPCGE